MSNPNSSEVKPNYEEFNGKWIVPKIPEEFNQILKLIGYSTLERQYFKKSSVALYSLVEDEVLSIRVDSPMYKNTKKYPLNGEVVEYVDDRKNKIIEYSVMTDLKKSQTTTIYPDKNITVIDTRELISPDQCLHTLRAIPDGGEFIDAEIIYIRDNSEQ